LSSDLTKGQKIAKVCAETGITDTGELYQEIEDNCGFDVAQSYVSNVLNKNIDIDGFSFPDNGKPEFHEPIDETRQEVLRIGRLNLNESYRTIYNKCRDQGLDVTYAYVWDVVSENTPKEKRKQDGTKKRAIIKAFNETKKTGSELSEEVRKRGYDVSEAMLRKTIREIDGYWDAKPKTKKEKIREVAERVEYSSHGELADHINRNEDFDVIRAYVSEALRESQSSTQQVYVAILRTDESVDATSCFANEEDAVEFVKESVEGERHEYEKIGQHTWTTHGRMWKVAESGLNDELQ
jgi:arginine repressor